MRKLNKLQRIKQREIEKVKQGRNKAFKEVPIPNLKERMQC